MARPPYHRHLGAAMRFLAGAAYLRAGIASAKADGDRAHLAVLRAGIRDCLATARRYRVMP